MSPSSSATSAASTSAHGARTSSRPACARTVTSKPRWKMPAARKTVRLPMPPETADRDVTACLVIIGNEILSGRTQDANLAYLGKGLNDVGVRLMEVRVIP